MRFTMLLNISNLLFCCQFFVVLIIFPIIASPPSFGGEGGDMTIDFDLDALVEDGKHWAHSHGLVMRTKENKTKSDIAVFYPFALFPTPFPRQIFEQAQNVQTAMQLLYFRMSNDYEFLREQLQSTAESNEIVRSLMNILQIVHEEGVKQPFSLVLLRSDYMCDVRKNEHTDEDNLSQYELKQIEVNIGQIGGLSVAALTTELHRRMMAHAGLESANNDMMPQNLSDSMIVDALIMAWKKIGDKNAIILIIAGKIYQNNEQYNLNFLLQKASKNQIKIVQMSLAEAGEILTLDETDHSLRFGAQKVAVVFYKSFSSLNSPNIFAARLMIERSTAIKMPTVANALAGQKKIQQVLALPGMVERFFPDDNEAHKAAAIRATFTGLWGLDNPNEEKTKGIIQDAIAHPDNYVLKPSREGGGNNFWGKEISEKLLQFTSAELSAHILMQRLTPFVVPNFTVRPMAEEAVQFERLVSELSVYGFLLGDNSSQHNVQQGHNLRSKPFDATEGGVFGGGGVVDSPFLF